MTRDLHSCYLRLASTLFQLCALIAALHGAGVAQNNSPVLLSHSSSTRAVALESVTRRSDPFSLTSLQQFGSDPRTRIAIFARNVDLGPGEGVSSFTSDVQDGSGRIYALTVEYAGPLANCDGITMLVVRLSDDLGEVGDVLLRIRLRGVSSNRVRIAIGHFGGGPPDDPPGNQPPQVSVTAAPTSGISPLNVGFSSSASDPDGSIASYSWDFGDGQTSTQAAPAHLYQSAGSYTARLTVTDNVGASASASVVINVSGPPPPPNQTPQVSISAPVTSGVTPLTVGFTSSAYDPDGYIAAYSCTFGDGQTSSQSAPTHVYQSVGSFTARLTVTDNLGATASAALTITVSNPPPPPSGTRFKVLQWNVAYGRGTDNILDLNRQATWMANMQADLISLNEVPPEDAQRYADLLIQRTGVTWYYRFGLVHPSQSVGQLILSRFPLVSSDVLQLSAVGDPYTIGRSAIRVTVNIGGRTVHFFSTHLTPGNSLTATRIAQISELTTWADGFSGSRIIAGDFNLSPNWPEHVNMTAAYYDSWAEAFSAGTAVSYPDNPEGRTRKSRVDYINYSRFASNLALIEARMPDQRDLNNHNVVITVGNSNDWGVRPSDHNFLVSTFEVR